MSSLYGVLVTSLTTPFSEIGGLLGFDVEPGIALTSAVRLQPRAGTVVRTLLVVAANGPILYPYG